MNETNTTTAKDILGNIPVVKAAFDPNQARNYPLDELKQYDLNGWQNADFLTEDVRRMHVQAQLFTNDLAHRKNKQATPRWLTLCGRSGCGKSHLARAIVNVARNELGISTYGACFWPVARYVDLLRNQDWGIQYDLEKRYLLVLDDLGAEQMSEMFRAKLTELLDARLNKWTIITTNLSPLDIADNIDPRIASRLKRGFNTVCAVEDARDFEWERKRTA